jgi:hypothetical protein
MTTLRVLLFSLAAFCLIGCSKPSPAPAKISGSLTYKGQPIKAGAMSFHTPDGVAYPAQISEDGTYSATDLPEGELVVTVSTEHLNPARKAGGTASKDTDRRMKMMQSRTQEGPPAENKVEPYVKLPEKYSNPKTSPLTVTLKSGRQVQDINLD